MKTRSVYMKAPWLYELRDVELPDTPPPGYALLKVEACGLCGTDITGLIESKRDWHPVGHEVAGVIERLGPGAYPVKEGQRVVLESASFCGHCDLCRNGRVDLCSKAPNFWNQPAMGFSDRMIAPVGCMVPYEGLTPEVASLAEPAGVAYDMVKTADVKLGDRVLLVGPGPIGLMALALAKSCGASRIVCIGRPHNIERLAVALKLGAEPLMCNVPMESLKALHKQFDHVLMTAPTEFIAPALSFLDYGGVLTYIGIGPGSGEITFDANNFHFRKLQLRASFASPAVYFPRVLNLLRVGIIPGEQMISHVFRLDEMDRLIDACRNQKEKLLKIIVKP